MGRENFFRRELGMPRIRDNGEMGSGGYSEKRCWKDLER